MMYDPRTGMPLRCQYVRLVQRSADEESVAQSAAEVEVRTVPDMLYDRMIAAGVKHSVHLEPDDPDDGGRGASASCAHADRGRKPTRRATSGIATFLCEHKRIIGECGRARVPSRCCPHFPTPPTGSIVMRAHESLRDIWEWIRTHQHRPPELVYYDAACMLHQFVLARDGGSAEGCQFMCDARHSSWPSPRIPRSRACL